MFSQFFGFWRVNFGSYWSCVINEGPWSDARVGVEKKKSPPRDPGLRDHKGEDWRTALTRSEGMSSTASMTVM